MSTIAANLIADIERLLADNDMSEVENAVDTLCSVLARGEATLSDGEARGVLGALRGKRQFADMIRLGETLLAGGMKAERPRRLYAQALIDQGRLDEAEKVLHALLREAAPDSNEWKEARGLLGRIHKQRYIDAGRRPPVAGDVANLQRAINEYCDVVARGRLADDHWHTINFIALTALARRDGVDPQHQVPTEALADGLIATLAPIAAAMPVGDPKEDIWQLASLGEAHVAKGEYAKAREVYARYARNATCDAFEIFSSLRQLVEVWGLKRTGPGSEVVAVLEARLGELVAKGVSLGAADIERLARVDIRLGRPGQAAERVRDAVAVSAGDGAPAAVTATPRHPSMIGVQWLLDATERVKAVATIRHRHYGTAKGTGFVVRGADLNAALGDELLLLTNSHVIGALSGAALPVGLAVAEFPTGDRIACREIVWESPIDLLDAALVRLAKLPSAVPAVSISPLADHPDDIEELPEFDRSCRMAGIAGDGQLSCTLEPFDIHDLGYADPDRPHHVYLYHGGPTRDGSSGSPLFDEGWGAIALHRATTEPNHPAPALGGRLGQRSTKIAVTLKSIARQLAAERGDGAALTALAPPAQKPAAPAATQQRGATPASGAPQTAEALAERAARSGFSDDEYAGWVEYDAEKSLPFEPAVKARPPADGATPQGMGQAFFELAAEGASSIARAARNVGFKKRGLTLVSDGDSWFQFPVPRVQDTIDHLRRRYSIFCLASAGYQLRQIAAEVDARLVGAVRQHRPHGVLLSGGGNDLLGWAGIKNHVARYKSGQSAAQHIIEAQLERTLGDVEHYYGQIVDALLAEDRNLKIFCHGYDWALPDNQYGGGWLHKPMNQLGITEAAMQREIVRILINRLNERLATLEKRYEGSVFFVDCRGAVGGRRQSWFDELHPLAPGFHRVALRFRKRFEQVFDKALLET